MLRTRLWMGALLICLAGLILSEERWAAPWFPFLFLATLAACMLAVGELLGMIEQANRPSPTICRVGVLLILVANWREPLRVPCDTWHLVGLLFVGVGIAAFLREMWVFTGPNRIIERVALTLFTVFYLGVLPSFLLQERWLPTHSAMAIALTVFVPKVNDIGAYFTGKFLTGRLLGRHHMTPLLSPKKTWQGAIGGMLASVGIAFAFEAINPVFGVPLLVVGFALTVGLAGVLGDLAESLIKRDRQTKDASAVVPGFGGVLDVIDSLLFAAPVAYLWFVCIR